MSQNILKSELLYHVNYEPKDYQVEAVEFVLRKKSCIIGDDMGLGKTFEALMVAFYLDLPTQIICPAYLKKNWMAEIDKFSSWDYRVGLGNLADPLDLSVESYAKFDTPKKRPSLLIIDEGHYLKNPKSQRSKKVYSYVSKHKPEYLLILTGTPIKNRVDEFWQLLRIVHRLRQDSSFISRYPNIWRFRNKFCKKREFVVKGRRITEYHGLKNLELLRDILKDSMIRRRKGDVDSPAMIFKDVMIDKKMDESELENSFNNFWKQSSSTAKAKAALIKADFTFKYAIDLLNEIECLIIFSDHVNPIIKLAEKFTDKGIQVGVITGDTDVELRQEIVDSFEAGNFPVLLCTIGSASTGYTIVRPNHMIINDYPWVNGDIRQTTKRMNRIGQRNDCFYHIIYGGPVDKRIHKTLQKKATVLDKF